MDKILYDCWQALDPEIGRTSLEVERIVLARSPIVARWWRRLTFTPFPYLWRLEETGWARSEHVEVEMIEGGVIYETVARKLYFRMVHDKESVGAVMPK